MAESGHQDLTVPFTPWLGGPWQLRNLPFDAVQADFPAGVDPSRKALLGTALEKTIREYGLLLREKWRGRLEPAFRKGETMDAHTLLEQHLDSLRLNAESEIRRILNTQYEEQIEPGIPVKYYLDFKTDARLLELKEVLAQMESGSYGRCVLCRQPVEPDQLRKLVLVKLCERCASKHSMHSKG